MVISRLINASKKLFQKVDKEDLALFSGSVGGSIIGSIYVNYEPLLRTEDSIIKTSYAIAGGIAGAGFCWVNVIMFPHLQFFSTVPILVSVIVTKAME